MNNITVTANALRPETFNSFITYIDRPKKTTETYITNLRQFAAWLKYQGITEPERADIIAYRDWLISEDHEQIKLSLTAPQGWEYITDAAGKTVKKTLKPATVRIYMQTVKAFFTWTAAEQIYPNIAANIHTPKLDTTHHRKDSLTAEDVVAIENSINTWDLAGKRLKAMYLLSVNAGLRTIELERANIGDLEVKRGKAVLWVWGKGHNEPDIKKPLAPAVYNAIKEYLDARAGDKSGTAPLFASTSPQNYGSRILARTISQMLKKAMKDAGYDSERLTAHSLRHTAGTSVMELTNDLYAAQHYLRHASPVTTEKYLHNKTEAKEAEIATELWNYYHAEH